MNSEGLTNKQVKNLKDLLRKLGYSKEELGQLENLKNILKPHYTKEELFSFGIESYFEPLEEEWIRVSKKSWHEIIRFLIDRIDEISHDKGTGLEWLISKIAYDLYIKFDKAISQGQAVAVLKRALGIKLSSTGRTQLYELRKKIRKYENFLAHFGDVIKTHEFTFKVVILGLRSGQASNLLIIPPILEGEGQREIIGVGFYPKTIEIYDKIVKLQLWDISSETQWRSYIKLYCNGANGAIIVYDKSERDSFESAKELYNELKEGTNLKFRLKDRSRIYVDMPVILIGLSNGNNVIAGEGQSLAKEWGTIGYIEMQDTESQNFEKALDSLSHGIISNYQNALKRSPRKLRFKISVVGDVEVGKTSLIKKLTVGNFNREDKTIGAQFSIYTKEKEGDKIRILFWDIAGGKEFHHLREDFFKNSLAAIIVFSLGEEFQDKDSLNQISYWYEEILKYCGDIPIIVIANKADLGDETKLDLSKIQKFVNKNKLLGIYLTSAKTGQGINDAFNRIIEVLYNKYK
jgi:small GTP-binding protein